MTMLRSGFEVEEEVMQQSIAASTMLDKELLQDRGQMVRSREADAAGLSRRDRARPPGGSVRMATRKKAAPPRRTKTPRKPAAWKLRLYVAGQTAKSTRAFANLKVLCDEHLRGRYQIEVIDLLLHPRHGARRSDRRRADARHQTSAPGPQDHRRPVRHRQVLVGLALQQVRD